MICLQYPSSAIRLRSNLDFYRRQLQRERGCLLKREQLRVPSLRGSHSALGLQGAGEMLYRHHASVWRTFGSNRQEFGEGLLRLVPCGVKVLKARAVPWNLIPRIIRDGDEEMFEE